MAVTNKPNDLARIAAALERIADAMERQSPARRRAVQIAVDPNHIHIDPKLLAKLVYPQQESAE